MKAVWEWKSQNTVLHH